MVMQVPQAVYQYNCHIQFLNDRLKVEPKKVHRFSKALADMTLAKKLGYRSSRSVGMVLEGKRLPSSAMLLQVASHLKLDDREKRYLELLVQRERLVRRKSPVELVESEMKRLNPFLADKKVLDTAYFSYVADWYNFTLKQLIATPSFRYDFEWIQQRLKNKISFDELKKAFHNLKILGLIREHSEKISILAPTVTTTHDVPSIKIRQHHKQMMTRASEALDEESVENREFFSLTFRMDRKSLPQLKEQIRKFKDLVEAQLEDSKSDDVFQMNLQLFPHTNELQSGQKKQNASN